MTKFRYSPDQLEQMANNPWLTDRERRAFDLYYRRGWCIEDVAAEMYVSRRTVFRDMASIREKSR